MGDRHSDNAIWPEGPRRSYWVDSKRALSPEHQRIVSRALREQIRRVEERIALRKQNERRERPA